MWFFLGSILAPIAGDIAGNRGVAGNHDESLMMFVTIMNQDVTIAKLQKEEGVGFDVPLKEATYSEYLLGSNLGTGWSVEFKS